MFKNWIKFNFYNKLVKKEKALSIIKNNDIIAVGGFGLSGVPITSLKYISNKNINNLTIISNNVGLEWYGVGLLLKNKQIKRMISSYVGDNSLFIKQYFEGDIELEITPQGTIAEKLRAGGAGIPGFFTQTGVGTIVEKGGFPIKICKENKTTIISSKPKIIKCFKNKKYLLEESIKSDISLIKAEIADKDGNLFFRKGSKNFNQDAAKNGKITIVEAKNIVEVGQLDPNHIHIPGIYVDYIFKSEEKENIFQKIVNKENKSSVISDKKHIISQRAANLVNNGDVLNLGIGLPTFVASYIDKDVEFTIHLENGILGANGYPDKGSEDPDLIDPGKDTIKVGKNASFVSSSDSFSIIRGGHIDITMLGAMEVSQEGDLSNWIIPGKLLKGMGGAMDLVAGSKKVIILTEHTNKHGKSKILKNCTLPLTGKNVVDLIITELAVFKVLKSKKLKLLEISNNSSINEIKSKTEAEFIISDNLTYF